MSTVTQLNKQSFVFSEEEIPKEIFGVKIPHEDIERLRMGEQSSLLENIITDENSTVKDAKIKLTRDKQGQVKVDFIAKNQELEIPDKILGQDLNELQKNDLLIGKTVGPINYRNNDLYLKVDKELNRIVVSTGKELSIPNEIGGYKISDAEKNDLANGRQMKNKVLKGEHGYFLAKISITEDRKGLVFSDVKDISPQEATRLSKELNIDNRTYESGQIIEPKPDQAMLEQKEELLSVKNKTQIDLDSAFVKAYEQKNYKELVNLHSQGYVPGEQQLEGLKASKILSHEEKVSVAAVFDKSETVIKHKSNQIDNVITSSSLDKQNSKEKSNAQTAGSGIDTELANTHNVKVKSKEEIAKEKEMEQTKKQITKEGIGTFFSP